eukprot:5230917-Amphidinium_carterae.1
MLTSPTASTTTSTMLRLVKCPALFHPAWCNLLSGLSAIAAKMSHAPVRAAVSGVNAAFAAFEEGISGLPCHIASDVKALERPDCQEIAKAASSYGTLFKVVQLDTDGARNLVRAVTANVGMLSADTTAEQAQQMFTQAFQSFAEKTQFQESDRMLEAAFRKGEVKEATADVYHAGQGHVPSATEMGAALETVLTIPQGGGGGATKANDGGAQKIAQTFEEAVKIHNIFQRLWRNYVSA